MNVLDKVRKKKNSQKVKNWYEKKKQDPNFHAEYKLKQRINYQKRKASKLGLKFNDNNTIEKIEVKKIINCKICNKEFKPVSYKNIFCSKPCSRKDYNTGRRKNLSYNIYKNKNCKVCNKEFKPFSYKNIYCSKSCNRKWYLQSPETYQKKLASVRKWKENQSSEAHEKQLASVRKWKENNREKNLEINRISRKRMMPKWRKNRKLVDPSYHISETIRSYISRSIKGKIKEKKRTEEIVGIDFKDLVRYLEKKFKPGMTLSNYGKWHIDHIKPVAKFDLTISGELEKCFHYTNLQPLWAIDNLKKGKKF